MTKLFIRLFVKNKDSVSLPKVRESYGKLAGIIGICTNLFLATLKVLIGLFSNSIAIIADGLNNLTDASSSVITLVGFKMAGKPEDEDHPYGHARIEYLTGIFVSVVIIVVGVGLLKSSIEKVVSPGTLNFNYITIILLVVAILLKLWQMSFYKYVGKKINSLAIIATGTDSRNDVIATSAVLLSVIIGSFTGLNLDGYFGCLVAIFIIYSGIQLIRETSSPLLGEAPDIEIVNRIKEIVKSYYPTVLGMHDLVVHNYGPGKIFASIHLEVDADGDLMESHDVIDLIEKRIKRDLHIECTGHLDPIKKNDPLVAAMHQLVDAAIDELEGLSEIHDLRIVPGKTHTNVIFDVIVSHNCKLTKKEIHEYVEKRVKEYNKNFYVVITYDIKYIK